MNIVIKLLASLFNSNYLYNTGATMVVKNELNVMIVLLESQYGHDYCCFGRSNFALTWIFCSQINATC